MSHVLEQVIHEPVTHRGPGGVDGGSVVGTTFVVMVKTSSEDNAAGVAENTKVVRGGSGVL